MPKFVKASTAYLYLTSLAEYNKLDWIQIRCYVAADDQSRGNAGRLVVFLLVASPKDIWGTLAHIGQNNFIRWADATVSYANYPILKQRSRINRHPCQVNSPFHKVWGNLNIQ